MATKFTLAPARLYPMAKQIEHGPINDIRRLAPTLQVGQAFNPFGLFTGIFIPDALVRSMTISAGAKLTYGRLARYAGQDGNCYPAVPTLAAEIGMSTRQTQNYLAELERHKLIRRLCRFAGRAQTSNAFQFLWHVLLEEGVKKAAPEGVQDSAPEGVQDLAPKESQIEESYREETDDSDYPATSRKKHDSRPDLASAPARCKQYPHLRDMLAQYMMSGPDDEKRYPNDRQVVDIMDAAAGATEDTVFKCLSYLYNERKLRPGTRNGPRHFSWFVTVVGDYFWQKRAREEIADPGCHAGSAAREERVERHRFRQDDRSVLIGGLEVNG
ncbi:MAG: helix-turn-helix domain-containing protein [Bryobacteraceae bacterium]